MNKRRPAILAVAILVSALLIGGTGGAIAAGKIGTAQLENGAVTAPKIAKNAVTSKKIKNKSVGQKDLASTARGAKVIRYPVSGSHNFATSSLLCVKLPGTWTADAVRSSQWSAGMESGGLYFPIGNWGFGPSSEYRLSMDTVNPGRVCIYRASGPGETYDNISFYRTMPTKVVAGSVPAKHVRLRG